MIRSLFFFFIGLGILSHSFAYEVNSEKYSLHLLDQAGNPVVDSAGLYLEQEGLYTIPVQINPKTAALIVMDPWIDHPVSRVQNETSIIMQKWLIPLVYQARAAGHIICIMTNNPKVTTVTTKIAPELKALIDKKSVFLLYHQQYSTSKFSQWLKNHHIKQLIYTGFASNMCILGRPSGAIPMFQEGFQLFFIPEASCAVEPLETSQDQTIHQAYSRTFSMSLGGLIHWNDFMKATADTE